jgi:hypothetical protein
MNGTAEDLLDFRRVIWCVNEAGEREAYRGLGLLQEEAAREADAVPHTRGWHRRVDEVHDANRVFAPHHPLVRGRAAIEQRFRGLFTRRR